MLALSLHTKHPLISAWIAGTVINIIAICLSYKFDLPTGYTLVAVHTVTAMCAGMMTIKR